jgi:hypothetical protein
LLIKPLFSIDRSRFMNFSTPLPFSISLLGILLGAALALTHLFGLLAPDLLLHEARTFSRSRFWGTVLLTVTTLWTLAMTATTDLGEFNPMRHLLLMAILAGSILLWKFVPDFLSSRSLGFLLLLVANPVLQTTFLQHGLLKIMLTLLAYGWAVAGLFLVGIPYLYRDIIHWMSAAKWRWNATSCAGLLYGIALIVLGLLG